MELINIIVLFVGDAYRETYRKQKQTIFGIAQFKRKKLNCRCIDYVVWFRENIFRQCNDFLISI